ncbi:MAG TPA: hypothetical protein VFQ25_09020 [Ktedonobacterales bacterium]|nr:hypothetical protein [Ktedonobacterales bacterium]
MPDMPLDPTNMPFQRARVAADRAFMADQRTALKAESILIEEFNYAGVVAYQAREDSANLINVYLLATGALATGLGVMASVYSVGTQVTIGFIGVTALVIFALFSFAFFARFLGLEEEYRDGAQAMGIIREFYIYALRDAMPEIELAFHWRMRRRPLGATLAGGSPLVAWVIALLSGLSAAGAVGEARLLDSLLSGVFAPYAAETVFGLTVPFFWEILFGLLVIGAHLAYYLVVARRYQLRARAEAAAQAARIEAVLGRRA